VEPLPNINKVFSLVIQKEIHLTGVNGTPIEAKVLFNYVDKQQDQVSLKKQGRGNN